jgi:LysR family transcriptional regulator (chromosome initiation inhibitor)
VLPALAPLAGALAFDIHREDEEHTLAARPRSIASPTPSSAPPAGS